MALTSFSGIETLNSLRFEYGENLSFAVNRTLILKYVLRDFRPLFRHGVNFRHKLIVSKLMAVKS
jgi:hypothetical protein